MTGDKKEIAKRLRILMDILEDMGIQPILWAGTMLGAVRGSGIIEGDDDVDIAYTSKYEDPVKVEQECIELYKELSKRGLLYDYFDIENQIKTGDIESAFGQAHLYLNRENPYDFKADLFTTWKTNGRFYDPWFGDIGNADDFIFEKDNLTLEGIKFNGLKVPENLFVVLYGTDWRTPREDKGTNRNSFRHALKEAKSKMI